MTATEHLKEQVESMEMMLKDTTSYMQSVQEKLELYKRETESSLRFAKMIQDTIFRMSGPAGTHNTFIFHQQKDIVGGDFPVIVNDEFKNVYAMIDCTGHGIPGGFLTMYAHILFSQIVSRFEATDAGTLLTAFNRYFYDNFGQQDNSFRQGMDMSLIVENKRGHELSVASARRPVEVFKEQDLHTIRGDKMSIGQQKNFTYTNHRLNKEEISSIVMYSDGFPDQFGKNNDAHKEKKFKLKPFRKLLKKIHDKDRDQKVAQLKQEFERWKGVVEQTDDVLVLGVEF